MFLFGCQEPGSGPVGPEGLGPQFSVNCVAKPDHPKCGDGGDPGSGGGDAFTDVVNVRIGDGQPDPSKIISGDGIGNSRLHIKLLMGKGAKDCASGEATGLFGVSAESKEARYDFVIGRSRPPEWRLTLSGGDFTNWPQVVDSVVGALTFSGWSLRALTKKGPNPCSDSGEDDITITVNYRVSRPERCHKAS